MQILETAKAKLMSLVEEAGLEEKEVLIRAACLTPEEAIGSPTRTDYPIIRGKEKMVEANFLGAKGQAFTDMPITFDGTIADIMAMPLDNNGNRALFIATLNAVLRHLDLVQDTVHCKDDEPEQCGKEVAAHLRDKYGEATVGLVGFNPALAEHLVDVFGKENVVISDLFAGNIGANRFGVDIMDGDRQVEALVSVSDVLLITGTTITNDTYDGIRKIAESKNKPIVLFGVTGAGVARLTNIDRFCFCGHSC